MKRFLALVVLVFVGVVTWHVGQKLSPDALGVFVGVMFGVLAGLPTAALLLIGRRSEQAFLLERERIRARARAALPAAPTRPQPPVVVYMPAERPLLSAPEEDPIDARWRKVSSSVRAEDLEDW